MILACGHVVEGQVAGHAGQGAGGRKLPDPGAYHHAQLTLVVDLVRHGRDHDRLLGTDHRVRELGEDVRVVG